MLSLIIYFAILNTCSSLCPAPFNNNLNDGGCLATLQNPGPFYGHGTADINWDPNIFQSDIVNIRLLTAPHVFNQSNCYYGYTTVAEADRNDLFSDQIPNTGSYTWHVLNVNYASIVNYYFTIIRNIKFSL